MHKENNHINEGATIANDGVISNLEYALEDVKTHEKVVMSKNESILLDCTNMNDMLSHNDEE